MAHTEREPVGIGPTTSHFALPTSDFDSFAPEQGGPAAGLAGGTEVAGGVDYDGHADHLLEGVVVESGAVADEGDGEVGRGGGSVGIVPSTS